MTWREKIAEARRQHGWTQAVLAVRAGFGQSQVARWEAGPNTPNIDQFATLARALGVTVGELYGDSPSGLDVRPTPEERAILGVVRARRLSLEEAVERLAGTEALSPGRSYSGREDVGTEVGHDADPPPASRRQKTG